MKNEKKEQSNQNVPPVLPRRFAPLLRRAWYGLNQTFRRRIAYSGITPDQYTMLRLLSEGPPEGMTQRELCTRMSSDPNTIASLLNRMQAAGVIERSTHERDRRAHRVCILPKGRSVFADLLVIANELQGSVMHALPEKRREQFLKELEMIADACQASIRATAESGGKGVVKPPETR
jgi:DNA-binding MarR family transcriptional regulator